MTAFSRLKDDLKVVLAILGRPGYGSLFWPLWLLLLWLFVYLTNIGVFRAVFTNPALTIFSKIEFVLAMLRNIFLNAGDPRAFSIIVFSLLAAVNLVLMLHLVRLRQKIGPDKTTSGSVVALIGSHCVACGGSLLAPIVTLMAGSGAYFSAERAIASIALSTAINLIGIVLITRSTLSIARRTATTMPQLLVDKKFRP